MARSLQQDGKTVAPATAAQLLAGVNMNPVVEKEKDDEEVLVPGSEKYNLKEKRAEDLNCTVSKNCDR